MIVLFGVFAEIARIMEVSPTTLHHFVRTRKLQAGTASSP